MSALSTDQAMGLDKPSGEERAGIVNQELDVYEAHEASPDASNPLEEVQGG